ncbi:hypothetical protein NBRC3188_3165 [Acetobacter pasteurianus NBRC 3188]|uniref:Uncharacterized protein n=1 Tax=Acetobacter pasteurianus NBRC 3188 TaxID=1226663 RepID=A0A401WYM7_ACEPA|nr:hypothetical protein NBRC3188_3165 [Acetobacter pasteurianus NBRC 3188]
MYHLFRRDAADDLIREVAGPSDAHEAHGSSISYGMLVHFRWSSKTLPDRVHKPNMNSSQNIRLTILRDKEPIHSQD